MRFPKKSWADFRTYSLTESGAEDIQAIYQVAKLTGRSALEVMRMPAAEFTLNLIVAETGMGEERRSYFETLASLLSSFLKAIFGK